MRRKPFKLTVGEWGWLGLTTYVIAVDTHAWRCKDETMSIAFGRYIQSPKGKLWCAAIWGGLTAHLFWSLPIPGSSQLKKVMTYDQRRREYQRVL